jgi:signal transduction histidine kinase
LGATIDTAAVQAIVSGDESSVRAAVEHLLSNALRFAKLAEPPRVKLWTERREGWVRLWIEDNGVGIDERYRSKLFGVFQRLPQAELRPGAGTGLGLGLALVKRNIERIGGRVGVESNLGEGSRFWVELKPALADRRAE